MRLRKTGRSVIPADQHKTSFIAGFLVLAPLYLAVLILLKAMASLVKLIKPFAAMLPEWMCQN